jgi:DTW domain-containing protein YfiP
MDPKQAYKLISKNKQPVKLRELEGVVILDGTWQQSKALWWRNPWLLKLNRLVLNPASLSLRTQVRDYYMSTAEAVAQVMGLLHRDDVQKHLLEHFKRHIDAVGQGTRPS